MSLRIAILVLFTASSFSWAQDDRAAERDRMVREQLVERRIGRSGGGPPPSLTGDAGGTIIAQQRQADHDRIENRNVLEAMRSVPRHWFVPPNMQSEAYADRPLPIGYGQTISQPYIVALMTELLDPKPGERILEIGTGSGYQAAILTKFTPDVYTIEIVGPLHQQALPRLQKFGLGADRVIHGDGYFGLEKVAPFDGIIVTAAADHIPPPLIQQLKPGGRMIIPVGPVHATQRLVVVRKQEDGKVRSTTVIPVRFVPLTGGPRGQEKK
ncbi:MAG TPA: protein-L-isoaspartate(D-aspartate) O-methyltransferase [Chthoniobacterales bacterium]|nr:protein-L-isoaspartate(D-aspartate) O-methyltransferase [Chthoniobacterales bacterium]